MTHQLTLQEVHECLMRHRALVVHFSTVPNISDFNLFFPKDLEGVIDGNAMDGGLCCSAVKPGDIFHGSNANSFGSIGVAIDFRSAQSLRAVTVGDGGAMVINGKREFDEKPFDVNALEASLTRPSTMHNEWGVRDYLVRGLFIAHPIEVEPERDKLLRLSVEQVRGIFPDQRIYSFGVHGIVELHPTDGPIPIEHSQIYRTDP